MATTYRGDATPPWNAEAPDRPACESDEDPREFLRPIAGILNGLLLSIPLWGLIGSAVWIATR